MRQFSADYLRDTRRGMWDDRSALADLALDSREHVLDVGCGTGELSRVLAEETPGEVVGCDADPGLLALAAGRGASGRERTATAGATDPHEEGEDGKGEKGKDGKGEEWEEEDGKDEKGENGRDGDGTDEKGEDGRDGNGTDEGGEPLPVVAGDALRLPFRDDSFDLVVCQALLINLPDPAAAVREFRRVSSDLVAAVEPDNAAVSVESTVDAESALAARARRAYLDGVATDVTLGGEGTRAAFADAGLSDVSTRRHVHARTVEPPYDDRDLRAARRKASGEGLADDRATLLAGDLTAEEYDDLRTDWREMGRAVIEQMRAGEYRRAEVVPFYVTVGSV